MRAALLVMILVIGVSGCDRGMTRPRAESIVPSARKPEALDVGQLVSMTQGGDVGGVRALLDRGADPNYRYRFSWSYTDVIGTSDMPLLMVAAKAGQVGVVRLLVGRGARLEDLSSDDSEGRGTTALGMAAFHGQKAAVLALIDLGARVEPNVAWSARPLFLALYGQVNAKDRAKPSVYTEISEVLDTHGAKVKMVDKEGCTLLHEQTTQYSRASMQWVMDHGIDLNARDRERNYPPLYMAVAGHQVDAVRFFLEHNADTTIKDWKGRTALRLAEDCGFTDIAGLLRQHGAKR